MNPNDYINRVFNDFSPENSTESNTGPDLTIDLRIFAMSLITLRENMTYIEFDGLLRDLARVNDQGKLEEFLKEAQTNYSQGSNLVTAFDNALFDVIVEQKGNF